MKGDLVLFVDKNAVREQETIDKITGQVRRERVTAGDQCDRRGIQHTPMTAAVKEIELYRSKKQGEGGQAGCVTIGDLGPFVLVRLEDGKLVNKFGVHDIPKPMKLSWETVAQLSEIFGGKPELPVK